jgi:hypothetical protein
MASGYKAMADRADLQVHLLERGVWTADIFNYLKDPARGAPKRIPYKAMKYVLIGDDMFYRTLEGLLLKCLGSIRISSYTTSTKALVGLTNRLIR